MSPTTPRHLLKLWTSKQLSGILDRLTVGGGLLAQSTNSSGGYCSAFGAVCPMNTTANYEIFQGSFAVFDLRAGVLRREAEWVSPTGRLVRVSSTRMVSFTQRSIAAISYEVEPLDDDAVQVVVQSELVTNETLPVTDPDPRAAAARPHEPGD